MGVVHHPRFLVYFEVARTQYLRELGFPYGEVMRSGTHLAVVDVGLRYLRSARYDEELTVVTACTECTGARLRLDYEVRRGREVLVSGFTRLGAITPEGRPTRLPPELRERLTREVRAPGHDGMLAVAKDLRA